MSDTLQFPNLLLETATDLAHSVITGLKEKRTEDSWRAIWSRQRPCAQKSVSQNHRSSNKRRDNPKSLAICRNM
ncbi:Hypothetical protein FKW44_004589 [Caligus rogercresseyi]|uniref:Uncharacterized protein n=1 Tax=Caligus rogercresseyi TaxID=217165 RepID=A0A7T8KAM8_CALRO|nr:Hypothetical protein FKW44_004589 [Caligus rogercresseyi]